MLSKEDRIKESQSWNFLRQDVAKHNRAFVQAFKNSFNLRNRAHITGFYISLAPGQLAMIYISFDNINQLINYWKKFKKLKNLL